MDSTEQKKNEIIRFEIQNNIGILRIDNGSHNKIHQADFLDLDCLKGWLSDPELKGLVIVGQGRHFSAGADIEYIKANQENLEYFGGTLRKGKEILNYIAALPLVTVAAISGACFGAGLEIALSCQFRICTSNAVLAFPESNIGIMPGFAGTVRLPQVIGRSKALEIIISGRSITADEACAIGLVDQIAPNKEHLATALQFIDDLTQSKTPQQIKNIIQAINNSCSEPDTISMEREGEMFLELVKNV